MGEAIIQNGLTMNTKRDKVLIYDDFHNKTPLVWIANSLKKQKFELLSTGEETEAINIVSNWGPNLILCDLRFENIPSSRQAIYPPGISFALIAANIMKNLGKICQIAIISAFLPKYRKYIERAEKDANLKPIAICDKSPIRDQNEADNFAIWLRNTYDLVLENPDIKIPTYFPEETIIEVASKIMRSVEKLKTLKDYLIGYRTNPLLKTDLAMGGTEFHDVKDFIYFLAGQRGYIRINKR